MNNLYIVAGTSRKDGVMVMHYSEYYGLECLLERSGHSEVNVVVLSEPMTKYEVVIALMNDRNFSDGESRELLEMELEKVKGYEVKYGREIEMELF